MKRHLLIFILFFALSFKGYSQSPPFNFNHLTRNEGLASNRVNCIYETKDGFMWFGTEDGLTKFDGYACEVFRNNPDDPNTIVDNTVNFIAEDKITGNLIVATSIGLVYFDRSLIKFQLILQDEIETSANGIIGITSLLFDENNRLWIGCRSGLYQADLENMVILNHYSEQDSSTGSLRNSNINSLIFLSDGKLWIGHEEGIDIFSPETKEFTAFHTELNIKDVMSIYQDDSKGIWIGSNSSGLYYFPESDSLNFLHFSKESGHLAQNRVHSVVEISKNLYGIIVRDGGFYFYNQEKNSFSRYTPDLYNSQSINSKAVISLFKSSQGIIWIGTYNSGVNYINNNSKKFEHYKVDFSKFGLFNNNIRALFEDSEGYIWIGTKEEGGLSRFDRKTNTFKNYKRSIKADGLTDDYIFSINELDSERLLIGTFNKGMAIFNKKKESFKYYVNNPSDPLSIEDNRVYVIFKDVEGRIWVGHQSFLQEFIPTTNKFNTIAEIRTPKCIIDHDRNSLWIGTRTRGLFLYNKKTGSIKEYKFDPENANSISSNDIFSLRKDSHQNLWIGTKHGLCKLNLSNDSITRYYEHDGLASNWICALELDNDNNLWASTINGLSRLNMTNNTFRNYDIIDGLQGNEFEGYVSLKTKDDQILFGGRNGFNIFSPSNITNNTIKPNIVLTGFKLFNKEVTIGEPGSPLKNHISKTEYLKLKHDQSAFTMEYTALNFTSPEKNQYKYILEGFDKDWVSAGNMRTAIYTNIPPGKYTFRVIGSNNDDYWNEMGTSLKIDVLPPPWKTHIAYFIYVVILLFFFFIIRKMLIIRIEQKQLIEFERKDKSRIQELNNLKLRFFTNIAHEFRTPLTLISGPIEKMLSFKNDNEEHRYLLTLMHNNVKRLLQLINELMDFRKAENEKLKLKVSQNDPVKLLEEIIQCFEDSVLEKSASLNFSHKLPENAKFWFDFSIIEKVIFNLLSNALKHTPQGGRISIDISIKDDFLEISVSDTGKGISKQNMEGIFDRFFQVDEGTASNLAGSGIGLAFSKRLIEVHHGSIDVESILNIGSKFTIQFPVSRNFYKQEEIVVSSTNERSYLADLPAQYSSKAEDKNTGQSEKLKHEKILIIEDNDEMRNFLVNNLGSYTLFAAENGKIGYDLALKEIPDIIISDVVMPEMSGLQICEKLKTQMATSHIPIILLSSKTEVAHKIEGLETGADAYIDKPFDLNYLQAAVKNLLKQREKLRTRFTEEPGIDPSELGLTSHEKRFIEKVFKIIGDNIENPDFSVEILGTQIGLSRSQLFRKFKILYDLKPSELIRTERLKKAKSLLSTREFNINEVAYQTGFKSASYFITSFKKYYGITPNEFIHRSRK